MSEHLSKQFDSELDSIRAHVTRMGGLVEEQLLGALNAFGESNQELSKLIVERDKGVDEMEMAIDTACANIVVRRQPTAIDLRMVMAVSKAVTDLERIGDEAKKIAKTTRKIIERGSGGCLTQILQVRHMGEQTATMLREVLDAFVRLDFAAAASIVRRDKEVDQHFRAVVRQLITYMMEDPRTISTALDVIFIAKSIERVGDHCKNIAEDVIYIAKGRDVRHLGLKGLAREMGAE
ncbi:MAG: phosphate signaling complex protein PhoU [Candidatus Accumulibacter sp.]|nr:phosphate signaling complex protein PhoU [Accumulibacter sp.]